MSAAASTRQPRRPARALLAEDNKVSQRVTLALLERLGFAGDAVASGNAALSSLRRRSYDLILLDLQLPGIDGVALAQKIRQGNGPTRNRDVPIIAISAAEAETVVRLRCLAAGMDDFLCKPVSAEGLRAAIARHVGEDALQAAGARAPGKRRTRRSGECPAVDVANLLERFDANAELARDLLLLFIKESDVSLATLGAALAQEDLASVAWQAHSLKGAAAYVSACATQALATELEAAAQAARVTVARALLSSLQQELDRMRAIVG